MSSLDSSEGQATSNSPFEAFDRLGEVQQRRVVQVSALLVAILAWETMGRLLGEVLFAPFSTVLSTLVDMLLHSDVLSLLVGTLGDMFMGYLLAVLFGVPTGLVMGRSDAVDDILGPWVSAFFVTSTSAMLPLLIIVFGINLEFRLVIVWLSCVWHILINVYHGARGIDKEMVDVGRSFDVSRFRRFKSITLPATIPYIAAGLRMGIGRAFRGIILAETYIIVGYGGLIQQFGNQSISTSPVLALILVIMVLAYFMNTGLEKLQDVFVPWADTEPSLD